MPAAGDDFERGHAAGALSERLAEHDRHFTRINGSMERIAAEMHELVLAVQRLADAAEADLTTALTLAAGLKDADQARRDSTEQHWSPVARLIAAVAAFAALASVILYATLH